ncbi:MAG: hypothetical protein J5802_06465 [Butyrivibrio sp.]|nr:hypothetical protein [Butyrivibrio sp.]
MWIVDLVGFILCVAAVFLMAADFSFKFKENIGNTIPAAYAVLGITMYVLSLAGMLRGVFVTALVYITVSLFLMVKKRNDNSDRMIELKKSLLSPEVICLVVTATVIGLLTCKLEFSWWDDINFWSQDTKQIFYLNGFAGKYGNVSPEFGDYPPAGSLYKCLFLFAGLGKYRENLQFLGYFVTNTVYMLPLLEVVKKLADKSSGVKKNAFTVVSFIAIVLFPGIFNGMIYYGTPADVTMGIVYGLLLLTIWDNKENDENFRYVKIFLYATILFLTKSVGVEWVVFALVFGLVVGVKNRRKYALSAGMSFMFYGSWLGFCLMNRRVAKLTGAGLRLATSGKYVAPANTADKAAFFAKAFCFLPMHGDKDLTLDISAGVMLIFMAVFLGILRYKKVRSREEVLKLAAFTVVTALLAYGIIFLAHISIFQTEDQYLDAYAMSLSIARYGCPFMLGGVYLLAGVLYNEADRIQNKKALAVAFLMFVFLTADYKGVFFYVDGYKAVAEENKVYIEDMLGESGRVLVDTVTAAKNLWGKRVLVMRDGHTYLWVHDAYINKEASPVALVYDGFMTESDSVSTIIDKILASHASYLYIEDNDEISKDLFLPLLKEGCKFESCKIYKIIHSGEGVTLE